jgi:hypothetical protein
MRQMLTLLAQEGDVHHVGGDWWSIEDGLPEKNTASTDDILNFIEEL